MIIALQAARIEIAYEWPNKLFLVYLPNLNPQTFKNDGAFAELNKDEEFMKLYVMFEQQ